MQTSRRHFRRRRIAAAIGGVLVLAAGVYTPTALLAPAPAAVASVAPAAPATPAPATLTWPSYGENAIGAVGFDGLLATSGLQEQVPIASLTKVITALVVLDAKPLSGSEDGPMVAFTEEDEAMRREIVAQLGLVQPAVPGTELSERDLLEGALVASANNYAAVLGRWAFGGHDEYLTAANAWLAEQGLGGTVVADAMGLSPLSVSTPEDMIAIGELALAQPLISEIVSSATVDVAGIGALANRNLLIGADGYRGIKTGTLDAAGKCLLWAVDVPVGSSTVTVVGVFLGGVGSPDHPQLAADVRTLVAGIRESFHEVPLATKGQEFGTLRTEWGSDASVVATEDASVVVWADTPIDAAVNVPRVDEGDPGDASGTATFTVDGDEIVVPLELGDALEPADGWWKLTHPESIF
ncbi:D-alanyl-D-alanine carboxypeptidase family protein [Planctomonas deserti]|uniref:D-alanyl-D-alanine carboxypeptidase family protein n=1 Tax=Planctomonas deserti TaxID=2144185 RepID=UPI000D3BB2B9|nr:D-alanyl-D-alanine carboxypeptidase [Planctomonas deserti]